MATHSIKKDSTVKATHTRIPGPNNVFGGKYDIPANKLDEFYRLYYDYVFKQGNKEYLTEKQDGNCIAVDFDFRYEYSTELRIHDSDSINEIIILYTDMLKKFFIFDEKPFNIYIFEKPNVNRLEDGSLTKDGIHMIIDIKMPHHLQLELRKEILKYLKTNRYDNVFAKLPLLNDDESVLDEGISKGTCNWQLYGSRKPYNNEAYELTYWFECVIDKADNEFGIVDKNIKDFDLEKDFNKLSVQYPFNNEFQLTPFAKSIQSSTSNKTSKSFKKVIIENDETDNESGSENQKINKNQELLKLIKINPKDRKTWMRVCACIKYNKMKNDDWLQFCKDNDLNMDKEKIELFDNFTNEYPIEIHYLQSLAKQSDPNGYKEWLHKWNIYHISVDDLDDPHKVATIISNTLKDTLKLCKENWYMLTESQLWKQQKEPSYYIINELKVYIDNSNKKIVNLLSQSSGEEKDKLIEISKKYLKSYKTISSSGYLNVLTKYLRTKLADDTFADKLDNNKGLLAFQNGIMNLETKQFRHGILSSDFITQTIPYDYIPSDFQFIKSKLKEILNNNDDHLEYFLSLIGYSLIGHPELEKSLYFMIDKTNLSKGDNGKTFFFDILSTLMPNYVYNSKATLLDVKNTKIHKQLVMMKGKRLVWLDEMPKEKDTNADLMKVIADGKTIENEIMFGTSETINIMFKLFALSNNIPKINPNETAVYNRYKQVSFNSHFDRTGERKKSIPEELKFIADAKLPTTIKEQHFNEVFNLVIHYANLYYTRGIPKIPEQFVKDTKETQSVNDEFGIWFSENCVICENEKVALKELIAVSGMNEKNVKEGMTRKGFKYDKDLRGIGKDMYGKSYKGGYKGIKLINDNVKELDDE
jgi:phage/plasmid-associated DNA primase